MEEDKLIELKRNALHETFQTDGWGYLVEIMEEARKNLSDIRGVDSEAKLHLHRGRVQQLDEILFYPKMIKDALNDL